MTLYAKNVSGLFCCLKGDDFIPCPHFKITITKRSNRQSAVAGAAYQSGESLFSEYDQNQKAYTDKKGIAYTEIMLPTNAPPEYFNRATLWNSVEMNEKQWNAQLARRIVLALPKEISKEEQVLMLQQYCKEQFVSKGMCVDFALHDKNDGNPHAHIMLTMRAIDENGEWLPKSRKVYDLDENGERIHLPSGNWKSHKENTVDWNEQSNAEIWRHSWEVITNSFLEKNNSPERVDLRSFERQGITEKVPTVHMGPAVFQMEKRGVQTVVGDLNRDIKKANRLMAFISKTLKSLHDWIERLNAEKQKLADERKAALTIPELLMEYLDVRKSERADWSDYGKRNALGKDLKKVSQILVHVQSKKIISLDDLNAELSRLNSSANTIRADMRKKENRIKELSGILKNHDTIERMKPIYDKYIKIGFKLAKAKYAETHQAELDEYNKAYRYLKKQGIDEHFNFHSFGAEQKNLKAERDSLQLKLETINEELQQLKDVRYYVSKVIPLDNEVPTTEDKKSITDRISEIQKEKAADKAEPPLDKQKNKFSELE